MIDALRRCHNPGVSRVYLCGVRVRVCVCVCVLENGIFEIFTFMHAYNLFNKKQERENKTSADVKLLFCMYGTINNPF